MKKILEHIVIGLGIGFVVSVLCLSLYNGVDETMKSIIGWMVASALYGLLTLLYDTEWLPLPGLIAVHLCGCAAVTLVTAWVLGYAESLSALALGVLPVFLGIYVVIGLGVTLYARQDAKKMNMKIGK